MAIKSIHITNYYHKDSGGISTAYNKLLEAANRRERYVRLIVPGPETTVEEVGEYGRIYYVKAGYSPVFDKRYRLMMPWNTYLPEGTPIKKILRDEKPDLIEIGEKYTLSLMGGLVRKGVLTIADKRPVVVHISCERMDDNIRSFVSGGRALRWFARMYIVNYIVPMFDFHVANSVYTSQELIDAVSAEQNQNRSGKFLNFCWKYWRAPNVALEERLFVNPCGVDNVLFTNARKSQQIRAKMIRENELPDDATVLLYAGRVSPEKNISLLPEMMKILRLDDSRNYRLLVAGSGPRADPLAAECEKLVPGSVKFLGQINDKQKLANLFANCDAFVHPNPREPFGITPLEAMASGLPVVAPNAGGILSYADNNNAWLADATAESFAAAVRDLFSNDEKQEEKVAKAILSSNQYSWEDSTNRLFAIYDTMYERFNKNIDLYDYRGDELAVD